ncbi:unnamed protein product [Auanema sp. JU1783]|nr:unnamed protein product [Auanema sp. JU1783]
MVSSRSSKSFSRVPVADNTADSRELSNLKQKSSGTWNSNVLKEYSLIPCPEPIQASERVADYRKESNLLVCDGG